MIYSLKGNPLDYVGYANFVINPTNLKGVMGAGLAKLFAETYPTMAENYKRHCVSGRIGPGNLHVHSVNEFSKIVNLATKKDWKEDSDVSLIQQNLETLKRLVEKRPHASIVLPLLGAGLGNLAKEESLTIIQQSLKDILNPIFIVDKTLPEKRFYAIVGSRTIHDYKRVKEIVSLDQSVIEMESFLSRTPLSEIPSKERWHGIVSGGAKGVDTLAEQYARDVNLPMIVIKSEWDIYSKRAGMFRNYMIARLASSASAIVNKGSVGTHHTVSILKKLNTPYRRTYIDNPHQIQFS